MGALKNPGHPLKTSWFTKLDGNITVNSHLFKVFREDADANPGKYYIVLRMESGTNESTADAHLTRPILVTDIVTIYSSATGIKDDEVEEADNQIKQLVIPTANNDGLTDPAGFQILNVSPQSESYLLEDDDMRKIFRKIIRWEHQIVQTS